LTTGVDVATVAIAGTDSAVPSLSSPASSADDGDAGSSPSPSATPATITVANNPAAATAGSHFGA